MKKSIASKRAERQAAQQAAQIQIQQRLANTRLLQVRPEVHRWKNRVICFTDNDNINYAIKIPYDFIAVGVRSALRLARAGLRVVAVYLPNGSSMETDSLPPELLLGVDCEEDLDCLSGSNVILVSDSNLKEKYAHCKEANSSDGVLRGVINLASILRYKTVMGMDITRPKLHLVTQLWIPKGGRRWKELCRALRYNVENNYVDSVHVLMETDDCAAAWNDWPADLKAKIVAVSWSKRLTYRDAFNYMSHERFGAEDFVGLINADIYFDGTIGELWSINMKDRCLALLRYEVVGDSEPKIFGPRDDSQDCWIFSTGSLRSRKVEGEDWQPLNFPLGRAGCDNAIAGELIRRKWVVCNPALSIKSYHLHESVERSYTEADRVSLGLYATIAPCGIMESSLLRPSSFETHSKITVTDNKDIYVAEWPTGPIDAAPYERGLSSLNRAAGSNVKITIKTSANLIEQPKKTIRVLKFGPKTVVTSEGLISIEDSIGFGENNEYSEALWGQTSYSTLSPTCSVKTTVIVPEDNSSIVNGRRIFEAGLLGGLAELADWKGEIVLPGEVDLASKKIINFLDIECKLPESSIYLTEGGIGLLPDPTNNTLLSPAISFLRKRFVSLLEDLPTKTNCWLFVNGSDELLTEFEKLSIEDDSVNVIGANAAPMKFIRMMTENPFICGTGSIVAPYMWAARQGATFIDLAPTIKAAQMATACGLNYVPLMFDRETIDEQARIINKAVIKRCERPPEDESRRCIYIPTSREGFHGHPGDSFRELVEIWAENGLCKRIFHDGVFCWLDEVGGNGTLLYDRPTLEWLEAGTGVPEKEQTWKHALFANTQHEHGKPWIFWARRPRLLERQIKAVTQNKRGMMLDWDRKSRKGPDLVFYGKIENSKQFKMRSSKATGHDWSTACDEFDMPVGGKYKFSQEEYLFELNRSRFGLCLPGFGPKCHREIECMAVGTVPIITPGVDIESYAVPPEEGIHYFRANSPEEARTIAKTTSTEVWEKMSRACMKYYEENMNPAAAWASTIRVVDSLKKEHP